MGLLFRSVLAVSFLFGLLYAFVFTIGIFAGWSVWLMIGITVGIVFLQYALSPIFINWIYRIEWIDWEVYQREFPHLAQVVMRVMEDRGIKRPRLGIIRDLNPNAFTFGWTKNSARVVLTEGILHYLDEEEQKGVLAHELGHVVHNDFILMTAVFAIPMILLTVARWAYYASFFANRGRRSRSDEANYIGILLIVIAVLSYVAYYIGYLISLLISRIREYYADDYSGEIIQNPNALSTGLVKIAYGLMVDQNTDERNKSRVRALRGLGIFDPGQAKLLGIESVGRRGKFTMEAVQAAAAWDLYNPWAKYYQLFSTHPLPAKRMIKLNKKCEEFGIKPEIDFSKAKEIKEKQAGKTMLDEFALDVTVKNLPFLVIGILFIGTVLWIFGVFGLLPFTIDAATLTLPNLLYMWALGFYFVGFAVILKIQFQYRKGFKPEKIVDLVTDVKVSPIRCRPAVLEGKIVGRGIPGYYFSEDLYFQDDTGLLFIDYRFGLGIVDFFFGILKAKKLVGQNVRITGWYRRGPSPYLQVRKIETASGKTHNNYAKHLSYFWAIIAFLIGVGLFYFAYSTSPTGFFGIF